MSIKAQLQAERAREDNKNLLEAVDNCKITDADFEKTCDNLRNTKSDNVTVKSDTYQGNSTIEKPTVDSRCANAEAQCDGKVLRFAPDTEETEKQSLKKQPKQSKIKYLMVRITDELNYT